jgi:hypothetical protein
MSLLVYGHVRAKIKVSFGTFMPWLLLHNIPVWSMFAWHYLHSKKEGIATLLCHLDCTKNS